MFVWLPIAVNNIYYDEFVIYLFIKAMNNDEYDETSRENRLILAAIIVGT